MVLFAGYRLLWQWLKKLSKFLTWGDSVTETKLATLEFFVNIRRTLLLYCRMRVLSSPQYNSHSVETETRAELSLSIVSNSRSESANWGALLQNF